MRIGVPCCFVCKLNPRDVAARFAFERVEAGTCRAQLFRERFHRGRPRFERPPDDAERLPVTLLQDRRVCSAAAALRAVATRNRRLVLRHERLDRGEERIRTKAVARTVRRPPFHSITPAFDRAIHDRGGLAVVQIERETLREGDLLPVESVRYENYIPIVQICQLGGCPLHILARRFAFTADAIRINRRLIPIDMQDDVIKRCGAGSSERFSHATRR